MKKHIATILLCFLFYNVLSSQTNTTGTEFWISFLENTISSTPPNNHELFIYIHSETGTSGTVSMPGTGWSQNFTVAVNGTTSVVLPTSLNAEISIENTILNKAIKLVSNDPVSVCAANLVSLTSDASLILPLDNLGSTYIVNSYNAFVSGNINPSMFIIVGTQDNTTIEIKPSADVIGGVNANTSFNVTINQGQVYLVKSTGDLSGTLVKTVSNNCNNFAVFAGVKCAKVSVNCDMCDHLYEQMIPVKDWGNNFITTPLMTRTGGDIFRILAYENNTTIRINNNVVTTLNTGEFYELLIANASFIQGDKPISVAQYSIGASCDGVENSDPFMIMLRPIEQFTKKALFNAFDYYPTEPYDSYVNIITETAQRNSVLIDEAPITNWNIVSANSEYSYARLNIAEGTHIIKSMYGFLAEVYGFAYAESYGYFAGAEIKPSIADFNVVIRSDTINYQDFNRVIDCVSNNLIFYTDSENIFDIKWNFGDGSPIKNGANVSNQFSLDSDNYIVTMSFQKPGKCTRDSISLTIYANNNIPTIPPLRDSIICNGLPYSISVEIPNAFYLWQDGSEEPTYTFSTTDNYSVAITSDEGCLIVLRCRVDFVNLSNSNSVFVTCDGLAGITANPIGTSSSFQYIWNTTPPQITQTITNLNIGTYNVTITDSYGCEINSYQNITRLQNTVNASVSGIENLTCFGHHNGKALINPIDGNSPYTITWNNPNISGFAPNNLGSGRYYFTVTDRKNCTINDSIYITSPSEILTNPIINNVKCKGDNSGSIKLNINGGVGPYSILWANGSTENNLSNLHSDVYSLKIKDSNNCTTDNEFKVNEPEDYLSLTSIIDNVSCHNRNDGSVFFQANGGSAPYIYRLFNTNEHFIGNQIYNIPVGKYTGRVSDKNGCVADSIVAINYPPVLMATYNISNPSCIGNNDGMIELFVTGGIKPYSFNIGNEITSDSTIIYNLYEGEYSIEISDKNICTTKINNIKLIDNFIDCLQIPNAFTPNGDGTNDKWIIEGINDFPDAKIEVYNQWGQIVFRSSKNNNMEWNGKQNNKLVPPGSYIYNIELHNKNNKKLSGVVTIIY